MFSRSKDENANIGIFAKFVKNPTGPVRWDLSSPVSNLFGYLLAPSDSHIHSLVLHLLHYDNTSL